MNRRHALAVLAAAVAASIAIPAGAHSPPPAIVAVDVYDRTDATALPVYAKDGRRYVVGAPGHEYAIRIRNCTGGRVLAVTSVDGVNVVTGQTASPDQSGYVLEPWGSVEIAGWRKDLSRTAAFYFTDLGDSYAARTGRPLDVGVIGVAAFSERVRIAWRERSNAAAESPETFERRADAPASAQAAEPSAVQRPEVRKESADTARTVVGAMAPAPRIGTGHGRDERSVAQQVQFERATGAPAQTVVLQYDRRENLVALGVLPPPVVASRQPRPFPGLQFVPDPPR